MRRLRTSTVLLSAGLLCAACVHAAPMREVTRARVLMGTLCTFAATATDTVHASAALDAALDEVARLDSVMSDWSKRSEVARVNQSAHEYAVACSPDLYAVLDSALTLARLSEGTFDPTVEPLVTLWDLRGKGRVPDSLAISSARLLVGHDQVTLDSLRHTVVFARAGMALNLGGIGKGYALDRAAAVLRAHGVETAQLDLGGQLLSFGETRVVGIAHPLERLRAVLNISVQDRSLSTSSQGEWRGGAGGTRLGHILDPRVGSPVPGDASVTVVCESATRADAMSTALFVMGRERAEVFASHHPDLGVVWLEPEGASVRAWRWNLMSVTAASGVVVHWTDAPLRGADR